MQLTDEKRKTERKSVALPLRYREFSGSTYVSRGTLSKNLSEGGIKFDAEGFLPLASHLFVEMNLPAMSKTIKAISKIAWIKKLPAGEKYEVGSHFLAMTSEDEALMSQFIVSISRPSRY